MKTIKKIALVAAILGVLLALNGCILFLDVQEYGDMVVTNMTGNTVTFVYIRPVGGTSWGEDLLGSDFITPGDSYPFYDIPVGDYEIAVTWNASPGVWGDFATNYVSIYANDTTPVTVSYAGP